MHSLRRLPSEIRESVVTTSVTWQRFLGTVAALVFGLVLALARPTTTASASTYIYDGPTVARIGAHAIDNAGATPFEASDVAEQSAWPLVTARGNSTTPSAPVNATETGYAASKINITEEALDKVFRTHLADGSLSAGKSLFNDNVTITWLIADADSVEPIVQSGSGNLQYIVDAGRVIGIDRETGQATSIYTVVTRSGGDLVTAFPGTPP
jgi:hypothetical protein